MSVFTYMFTALLVAFSVLAHELAHGYVALLEGDDTAQRAGRLTWNPLVHIDPLMTLVIPAITAVATHGAVILGGAKPVPVNPWRYRDGARSEVLVSLAGITANAFVALALLIALPVFPDMHVALIRAIAANVGLIVFNLLPIKPLDGWRVWRAVRA